MFSTSLKSFVIRVVLSFYCAFWLCTTTVDSSHSGSPYGYEDHISLSRSKRQLVFPNITLFQLNIGIGFPVPLKYYTLNSNYAIQANFGLPWNITQMPNYFLLGSAVVNSRSLEKRDAYEEGFQLKDVYRYIEHFFDSHGHNGTSCVLRTICQLSAQPLYSNDDEDILHQMIHFLATPSTKISMIRDHGLWSFIDAQLKGEKLLDCESLYPHCAFSPIDVITRLETID